MSPEPVTESVWDYPRPPALVPCERRVRIELGGEVLADSVNALRVLETSHPPTIYIPPADIDMAFLSPSRTGSSFCEYKGAARYMDAAAGGRTVKAVAWFYPEPSAAYAALRDHLSFYPGRVDAAWLDDERVTAQASDFYGGWISAEIRGPFKGPPGTLGW
jgi:uncharacterized protein (DUF427 family)